jgi:hypothetical protein
MGEEVVMADEYLLGLYEIGRIAVGINAPTVEACPRHVLTPAADEAVVEGEVVILAVNLLHVSLDHRHSPAEWQFVVGEHLQHVLVPEVLPLRAPSLDGFLSSEGEIRPVAEVEVAIDDIVAQLLDHLLVLGLIDRAVEELVLEGDVLHLLDAVDPLVVKRGHRLHLPHDHQVGLLVDNDHTHHQVDLLSHRLLPTRLLQEPLLAQQLYL